MKNTTNILLTALMVLLGIGANAQQFFFSAVQPSSCAANDGIVTIVPTQGVPPFTYLWSNGSTELSIRNVPKGVYSATLTDSEGATVTHTHILNSKALDLYLADAKPVGHCNPNSGALTVEPIGGQPPYTYSWSNGQTGPSAQGLTVGTYSVTVQDAAGCVALGEYEVKYVSIYYSPFADVHTVSEPDCANLNSGELSATMLWSGFLPYTYIWNTGATTETISNLAAGNYSVTVTDGLGCSSSKTVTLRKALTMLGSTICTGASSGSVSAELVNATPPVNYVWSNGQSGQSLNNLSSGTYSVTATDATGCSSINQVKVALPQLYTNDLSSKCYAGNNGVANCWVSGDDALSYLWDNGVTTALNNSLSPGAHSVTVTTALGCTLTNSVNIAAPIAPPIEINYAPTPANCAIGANGAMNISITGGIPPYNFYAWGPNFNANNTAAMQNLAGGQYYLSVWTPFPNYCTASVTAMLPDAGGFEPSLIVEELDCVSGYGAAAIVGVTMPGTAYQWSMGATTPDVHNLTAGSYSATVTGQGSCIKYFNFNLPENDTLQFFNDCSGLATGQLLNDLGIAGCNGTAGIPFQLIRTQPSGALNFTDANGVYEVQLPNGNFSMAPASYNPADIACPPGGSHSVNSLVGVTVSGLDFHFYNPNPTDHRVRQKALRTAQPGFPYSLRIDVCNDGNNAPNGTVTLEYGNFFGSMAAAHFTQHAGTFSFASEMAGSPNNEATFTFPSIAPGGCELLQIDFETPTTTPANTEFITRASVTPTSGDPTPDNNVSTLFNTVVGSFDPNSVFAYPARNGNPRDGGDILRNVDRTITYQIFFQNTGTAAANLVIVRDTMDARLNLATIRNITASHDLKVSIEGDNDVLVFKFPNINLPDSTADYANSIGSIQYEIDLMPNLPVGTEVLKQAAIYFDFNSPIITNENVLKVAETSSLTTVAKANNTLVLFPNPADHYVGLRSESGGELSIFNAMGSLVSRQFVNPGLQRVSTVDLPNGIYLMRLDAGGLVQTGKVVVSH
ncbi:MAG: T9SS type A sorting domain-containing protein [Saprospiraceae bacterium]|nr:T9SS type A sorting domain-containing protein [Saprospiraceae bacterium]